MIELVGASQRPHIEAAGRFVAEVLDRLSEAARPGTNLLELDELAADMIRDRGAVSCYVDYAPSFGRGPFGKVLCTSVNDAVLHGLPHDYALLEGDLLSLDFAASVDGWVADSALSVVVGSSPDPDDLAMIEATRRALEAGIDAVRPGRRLGDVSAAIGASLRGAGFEVNLQFGGHGVGRTMHQDPHVANDGRAGRGFPLRPGLALALEPWVMRGTAGLDVDDDGWTLRSDNGGRTAHSEHTVLVTEDGVEVLTRRPGEDVHGS